MAATPLFRMTMAAAILIETVTAFNYPKLSAQSRFLQKLQSTSPTISIARTQPMPWVLNTDAYGTFDQDDWGWTYTTVSQQAQTSYKVQNIEGAVPKDLVGTFYRIGAGNFERGSQWYEHPLDGDGFVTAFRLEPDGSVVYRGRFVETEFFKAEQEADAVLYRNVFGTQREGGFWNNAFDVKLRNVANTNLVHWGGRFFALWEAGRPYELDPTTLETLPPTDDGPFLNLGNPDATRGMTIDQGGPMDKAANLGRTFTAHPHLLDENTMVALKSGQDLISKDLMLEFLEYDTEWRERRLVPYAVKGAVAPPHDFSISENYYVFFQNRFNVDTLPFLLGLKAPAQAMHVPLDEPNILHLVPRKPNVKPLQIPIPKYFTIHNIPKVQEKDGKLSVYSNGWDLTDERYFPAGLKTVPFLGSWGGRYPDFVNGLVPPAVFYRTTVDIHSGALESHAEVIPGLVVEFMTQDPREPHIVYSAAQTTNYVSLPGTGHCKIDTEINSVEYWWAEPKIFTGEMWPVPKSDGTKGSWLMTIVFDAAKRRASLIILDSEQFSEGPVCRIHLPHPLAYSLHSCFIPASAE